MRLSLFINDIRLQWRQGFWLTYIILTAIYLGILFSIPHENRYYVTALLIFMDTSLLGLIFVGALLMFEKQQHILESLFLTPIKIRDYLLSKALSLTLLATCVSTVLLFLPNTYDPKFILVLFSVIASTFLFTMLGLGFASNTHTINQYFIQVLIGSMAVIAPLAPFLLLKQTPWLLMFPTNASVDLLLLPFKDQAVWRIIADLISLLVWSILATLFARRKFKSLRNR